MKSRVLALGCLPRCRDGRTVTLAGAAAVDSDRWVRPPTKRLPSGVPRRSMLPQNAKSCRSSACCVRNTKSTRDKTSHFTSRRGLNWPEFLTLVAITVLYVLRSLRSCNYNVHLKRNPGQSVSWSVLRLVEVSCQALHEATYP